jgi:ZipA, C-terminal FtsZ-binding domain
MNNDFQIALAGIAIGIVVVVVLYNRWQEAKYKKHAERAFQSEHADVLIGDRVEPKLGPLAAGGTFDDVEEGLLAPIVSAPIVPKPAHGPSHPSINEAIDSIALLLADQPLRTDQVWPTIEQSRRVSEGILWEGLQTGLWLPINDNTDDDAAFREIRAGLQLANRGGAIDGGTLTAFDEMMVAFAGGIGAVVQREDTRAAQQRAQKVDAFCADTDIEIAINLIGKNGGTFATTKVRGLAESAGMVAHSTGEYVLRDELGYLQFVLRNMNADEPPGIKQAGTYLTGLSFALDVPRTHEPEKTFERMMALVLRFADTLQGDIVDDNRKLLTANGRKIIADTIRQIAGEMHAHGVIPGSSAALRLYS